MLLAASLAIAALLVAAPSASAVPFATGDVFAAGGNGKVNVFDPATGALKQQLDDTTGSTFTTGMCFDQAGNLYVTNFSANSVSKFDSNGALVDANYITGLSTPESCVFDGAGNLYVGQLGNGISKYGPTGTFIQNYAAGRVDWMDLSEDQCTMLFTTEGSAINRYDVCADTPLSDFATGLPAPCFALRIRTNGEVLVACDPVQRLDSSGNVIQTYPSLSGMFALNLDPDGSSLWTGITGGSIDDIFRADTATGNELNNFSSNSEQGLFGLAVFGEITAAVEGPPGSPTCSDGIDNDRDGLIDLADPDCQGGAKPQCSDGIDNDGDGLIDFGPNPFHNDPDCESADDDSEAPIHPPHPPPQCSDGIDNDGDGLIDFGPNPFHNDPDCASADDNSEAHGVNSAAQRKAAKRAAKRRAARRAAKLRAAKRQAARSRR